MALPTTSTNAGYARPQKQGGSAGAHPSGRDSARGLKAGPGKGGTAGDAATVVDAKTGQNHVTSKSGRMS